MRGGGEEHGKIKRRGELQAKKIKKIKKAEKHCVCRLVCLAVDRAHWLTCLSIVINLLVP
jgi:hypothetical protein